MPRRASRRRLARAATWAPRMMTGGRAGFEDDICRLSVVRPGSAAVPSPSSPGRRLGRPGTNGTYHRPVALDIHPLTPERLPDLAELFGQGGDPKWCWCAYYRVRGLDFSAGGAPSIARSSRRRPRPAWRDDHAPGLVAYDGDAAVGWVSVGPREDYERLAHSRVLAPVDDTPVWSIVCFVVGRRGARPGRRQCPPRRRDRLRPRARRDDRRGLPGRGAGRRAHPARPNAYHGTLSMFERPASRSSRVASATARRPFDPSSGSRSEPGARRVYVICRGPAIVIRRVDTPSPRRARLPAGAHVARPRLAHRRRLRMTMRSPLSDRRCAPIGVGASGRSAPISS